MALVDENESSKSERETEVHEDSMNSYHQNESADEFEPMCCDPRQGYYRFIGLFFMCFLGFGSYFCYDTPGALQDQIKVDMAVSTMQFASLYSLYSWPNVVLCFVGGFLIDKVFGIRLGTIIFSSITTIGQVVYAFGGIIDKFWVMQLGRFIFGIGGESLAVAQNAFTVSWFKGKELNTVFGLLLSMSRIGSTVNFLAMGPLYSWVDTFADGNVALGISLLIAGVTCIFSLLCALILSFLDRRRARILHVDSAVAGEKIKLRDVLYFPLTFWLITLICVTYYVTIFPFIGLAKIFFMQKYNFGEAKANGVSSLVYVISAVASPFFGFLVDKTGRNIFWISVAVTITLGCHITLAFTFLNPFIPMFFMGLGYSLLASSLWPMVALVLAEHQMGTAYGLMQSVQNLGLALISMLGGLIVDKKGYFILEMFYILWLCVALLSSIIIWITDYTKGGNLNLSVRELGKWNLLQKSLKVNSLEEAEKRQVKCYVDKF